MKVGEEDITKLKNLIIMLDLKYQESLGKDLSVELISVLFDFSRKYKEFNTLKALDVINALYKNQKE